MAAIRRILGVWLCTAASIAALGAVAQAPSPAVPSPGAVQSSPLPPPSGATAAPPPAGQPPVAAPSTAAPSSPPTATITQPAAPPGSAPAAPPASGTPPSTVAGSRPTLIPESGDTSNVDEVVLPEKPAVIVSGSSSWDEGLKNLRAAFARLDTEIAKAGLVPNGRPLAIFTQTTDEDFRFDAMVPTARPAGAVPTLPPDMRFGVTPSGKAFRFVHKGPYDNIDATYETITAYLDVKDIVANDAFIEEYVNDVTDPGDPALEINIFVQPK